MERKTIVQRHLDKYGNIIRISHTATLSSLDVSDKIKGVSPWFSSKKDEDYFIVHSLNHQKLREFLFCIEVDEDNMAEVFNKWPEVADCFKKNPVVKFHDKIHY